jgi:hypothetical protein
MAVPPTLKRGQSTSIVLGFPDREETTPNASLCAFLPVKTIGLRFIVQADFDLAANRQDIHNNPWNRFLRDQVFNMVTCL